MDSFPTRKNNRLPTYNYAMPGYYFITVCTDRRKCILGNVLSGGEMSPATTILSAYGRIVEEAILEIPKHYPGTKIEKYVVMPNHFHLLLALHETTPIGPTVSRIVQQLKRAISMRVGQPILQSHYHDHVIRGEADYREIWEYIQNNPQKWALDRYYQE